MVETAKLSDEDMKALNRPPGYYSKGERSRILRVDKDHPYYRTSNKGNVSEPRLIMAEHLGRNLTNNDIVYHRDGNKDNNEVSNLVILTKREYHNIQSCARLERAVARINSKISVYKQRIIDAGIDSTTLVKDDPEGRWREVDRDREAFERSRRYSSESRE